MHLTANATIPDYGTKPERPGLYLGLFHGRLNPNEKMVEWGFNGPLIGPLIFVHTTYTSNIKLGFETDNDAKRYFPIQTDTMLTVSDDMVLFNNKFYGDWTVFYAGEDDCKLPQDTFRNTPRAQHSRHGHQLASR